MLENASGKPSSFCGSRHTVHVFARARVGPVKISSETGILTGGKWLRYNDLVP